MYTLDEKVVYPGHGVAKVRQVIEKSVGATTVKFYELKFLNKDMTILIPVKTQDTCGIRPLSTKESIERMFEVLNEPNTKRGCVLSSWNKRNKQYQFKIKTGDILEISRIYRDLQCMSKEKDLSFGERNLLNQTEALLVEEISVVKNLVEEQAVQTLRAVFVGMTSSSVNSHTSATAHM